MKIIKDHYPRTIKDHTPIRPITIHRDRVRRFGCHGIENGARACAPGDASRGCIAGFQRVMARCYSLGRFRIVLGLGH